MEPDERNDRVPCEIEGERKEREPLKDGREIELRPWKMEPEFEGRMLHPLVTVEPEPAVERERFTVPCDPRG